MMIDDGNRNDDGDCESDDDAIRKDDDGDDDDDIYYDSVSVYVFVTKNHHFLLGVSCNYLNHP